MDRGFLKCNATNAAVDVITLEAGRGLVSLHPVHGEFINHAAMGVWYNPAL
jgi:hypothetical protein